MPKVSDTINQALVLADNATQSAARLINALEKVTGLNSPVLDDEIRPLFELDTCKAMEATDLLEMIANHLSTLSAIAHLEERKTNDKGK